MIDFRPHLESELTENVTAQFGDQRAYNEVMHKATDPQVTIDAGTLSPFQELTVTLTVRQEADHRGEGVPASQCRLTCQPVLEIRRFL